MTDLKNVFKTLCLGIMAMLLLGSCASTVTDKAILLRIQANLNFVGTVSPLSNHYVIIFSDNAINLPNSAIPIQYFPLPGQDFDINNPFLINDVFTLQSLYEDYYSSWDSFILVQDNNCQLYEGPFPATTSTNIQHNAFVSSTAFTAETCSVSGSSIDVTFLTQNLPANNGSIQFNALATSKLSNDESGNLLDILNENADVSISLRANQTQNSPDDDLESESNSSIPTAVDFSTWSLRIF